MADICSQKKKEENVIILI